MRSKVGSHRHVHNGNISRCLGLGLEGEESRKSFIP